MRFNHLLRIYTVFIPLHACILVMEIMMMTGLQRSSVWVGSHFRDIRIGYGNYYDDKFVKIISVGGVTLLGYKDRLWKLL